MRTGILRAGMVAIAFVAAALGGVTARADVITLDVSATLHPGLGNCTPTCMLGGDIRIDNTNNVVESADVTASGFSPSVGPFTHFNPIASSGGLTELTITDSASSLSLFFSTPTAGSLVGYTGGALSGETVVGASPEFFWTLTSGSLTEQVAVPAPAIGRGLPGALALGGVWLAAGLLRRAKKPCSPGSQPA